ncbi:MAG: phosphoribosylformylglycinamidine synthase subunit PurS [Candidatus Cloacimonetes bacterium]|nr:phosphoribosylformylglycinamidine synthase subunit PurS [Candidatus Cloacimonadota bacterium]
MKAKVFVTLKPSVLDPQGKTVMHSLHSLGYEKITDVRVSKYIEISYEGHDRKSFAEELEIICNKVLANPNIEVYHYDIED